MTTSAKRLRGWAKWHKEKLLDARVCDLGLRIEGSPVAPRIKQLNQELESKDFVFRPHFWLSDEWYCPDDVPGVAIPFYLVHPKLRRLEKEFILEVEGGNKSWCMKLLRHETAHALLNAYRLDRRPDWKKCFGNPGSPYPDSYLPKPYSKRYVRNLPHWYAQSHPHEDWAETFSVWLKPKSGWRQRYRGWPALKKLEYVNTLMAEIKQKKPALRNKREMLPVNKIRATLRKHYDTKVKRYISENPEFFDHELHWLFPEAKQLKDSEKASHYIRRVRNEVNDVVSRWTSEYRYRVNEVLDEMIQRCDRLKLCVVRSDEEMKPEIIACITMLVMHKLRSGGFHISL